MVCHMLSHYSFYNNSNSNSNNNNNKIHQNSKINKFSNNKIIEVETNQHNKIRIKRANHSSNRIMMYKQISFIKYFIK